MERIQQTGLGICLKGGIVLLLCTFLIAFSFLAGCTTGVPEGDGDNGPAATSGTAVTDIIIPVDSVSDLQASNVMTKKNGVPGGSLIYEGLIIKDRDGNYIPSLAESWSVSGDAKTWTFHLIRNATWHDGVPVTCGDVKFTNDYLKENNLTMRFVLSDVDSVECTDDYTAVFHLGSSYSLWPDRLAQSPGIGVYPAHFWRNVTDPKTYIDPQFIGTGAFKFDRAEPGYVRLERYDGYHGMRPNITGVILKLITNKDSQILALKAGEVDVVTGISPAVAETLAKEPDIGIYAMKDVIGYEVAFNLGQYPSNISAFRHAMSHAVDRYTISRIIGNATPTETTYLLPSVAGSAVNMDVTGMYDYNLTKAGEMLAAAGFVRDSTGTLIGPDGKPVAITIPLGGKGAPTGGEDKIVTVLRNDWAKLGIAITTISFDSEVPYRKAIAGNAVFIDGMPSILHDSADDLVNFAVTPLQNKNYYNFNDPEYNTLVGKIRNTVDSGERDRMAYRMQEILAENVPTVPVCSGDSLAAYRKDRFTGFEDLSQYTTVIDERVLSRIVPVNGS